MAVLLIGIYRTKSEIAATMKEMMSFSKEFMKTVINKVSHILLNEVSWIMGVTAYTFVYARISTDYLASINIVNSIVEMFAAWFFGLSSASSVIIGNQVGKNNFKTAYKYATAYIIFSCITGTILGLLLYFNIDFVLSFYKVSETVLAGSRKILIITSIVLFMKFFNMLAYAGVFRGGADTKFSLITNGIASWGIGVPAGFIGGFILKVPIEWIYALMALEEVFNFVVGGFRFLSKKWINNVVEKEVI